MTPEQLYDANRSGASFKALSSLTGFTVGQISGRIHRYRKQNNLEALERPIKPKPVKSKTKFTVASHGDEWHRLSKEGQTIYEISVAYETTPVTVGVILGHYKKKTGLSGYRPGQYDEPEALKVTVPSFKDVLEKNTCRYISGDPKKNATYCGQKRKAGSSYCEEHHAKCYRRVPWD